MIDFSNIDYMGTAEQIRKLKEESASRQKKPMTIKEYMDKHLNERTTHWSDLLISRPCMDDLMLVDDENFKKLALGYQNHFYQINRVLEENGYEAG